MGRWHWQQTSKCLWYIYTHTNRTTYVGQNKDGLREGQGTWTLYDGSKFAGIWKNNRRWKGKSFNEEGKEIGEYVNGE